MDKGRQRRATASMPGTCGELVQGQINGRNFHVTCPIDLWSTITVYDAADSDTEGAGTLLSGGYSSRIANGSTKKMEQAIHMLWEQNSILTGEGSSVPSPVYRRNSQLIHGKGMGSSTADIVAAFYAVKGLLRKESTPKQAAEFALQIEPSDGTMYPGIAIFDHRQGEWVEQLGNPPAIDILMIDPGGTVNTVSFNRQRNFQKYNSRKEPFVRQALEYVRTGIAEGDPEKIGRGATISAQANQEILPKSNLEEALEMAKQIHAVGVNVAHSGTVIGFLMATDNDRISEAVDYIRWKRPEWIIYRTTLIGGGVR